MTQVFINKPNNETVAYSLSMVLGSSERSEFLTHTIKQMNLKKLYTNVFVIKYHHIQLQNRQTHGIKTSEWWLPWDGVEVEWKGK